MRRIIYHYGAALPEDGPEIVAMIDAALSGDVALRPEWSRGLWYIESMVSCQFS